MGISGFGCWGSGFGGLGFRGLRIWGLGLWAAMQDVKLRVWDLWAGLACRFHAKSEDGGYEDASLLMACLGG